MKEEIPDGSLQANPEKLKRIKVIHGELLARQNLDVIVSFLTEDLSWGGPINQKILTATNHQVDEYVLNTMPKLYPGDAFSTPAFGLPYKALIFGMISKWDNNFSGGERFLKLSTIKALEIAAQLGCQRIGIPSFSPGPDKYPLRKSARILFNALRDGPIDAFESIELICKSDDAYDAFTERFIAGGDD